MLSFFDPIHFQPPIGWRDCGPEQHGLLYYQKNTQELYECDGIDWILKSSPSPPTSPGLPEAYVRDEEKMPIKPERPVIPACSLGKEAYFLYFLLKHRQNMFIYNKSRLKADCQKKNLHVMLVCSL